MLCSVTWQVIFDWPLSLSILLIGGSAVNQTLRLSAYGPIMGR